MANQYISTRNANIKIDAKQAIIKGFSDDKGLFVLPDLSNRHVELSTLIKKDYLGMAAEILKVLLPDFSNEEINQCLHNAYDHSFSDQRITPVKSVDNFHVLELFHGPTSAFKDVGLQLLPELMRTALTPNQRVMILAATSGDTGTAALAGFKDTDQMGISVFFPDGGVSPIQKQQMLTTKGNNTNVAAINGNFDDAQTNVKHIFNDQQLKAKLGDHISLSSANSINIGRLIPQIVYYFNAYKQLVENGQVAVGHPVSFTVPTGNFGDVLAGYYAKLLGLPVKKLVVACNSNKVLADFFANGVYDRNRPFFKTVAPSMDIQISSNFERLLFYKSGEDSNMIKALMDQLESTGKYQVSAELLAAIQEDFACGYSDDAQIEKSIKTVFEQYHYLMDPHTASGYSVMRREQAKDPDTPMVLLSTASPYKFVDAVADAVIGHHEENAIDTTKELADFTNVAVPKNLAQVWSLPEAKAPVINPSQMAEFVYQRSMEVFNHD
ncbi:threonine synthase (plasmid) [Nicoliella spurrieriana]|uniref:Threonine synthase n=1 Tax=Nicoliella spurrieriana TaxID=2925830 RepID=A0A976X4X1_9LACO|nr:threonine synthase [Nicoliella spurrieriana]UQS86205.1 threonine synthase [Nicoliella spurrieriana]